MRRYAATLIRRHWNEIAGRGADADSIDLEPVLTGGRLRRSQGAALEVLAIGDENQDFVAAGAPAQCHLRLTNGACDVGAAARDGVGVDGAERLVKRGVIEGDGTYQKGAAGKCHDADGIAVQAIGEVVDRQFCAHQPIGLDVGRQHAARSVDCEHDLVAAAADLDPAKADEGTGQCREQQGDGRQIEPALRAASHHRDRTGELAAQMRRDEFLEGGALPCIRDAPHPDEQQARGQSARQPPGMAELHGNLR